VVNLVDREESTNMLWQIGKSLEEISSKLDRLIYLHEFTQKHELERFKEKILGNSEIRREIYGLCDGTKSVRQIAQRVGKSMPHVSQVLTKLEEAKLVRPKGVGRKKYYIRTV